MIVDESDRTERVFTQADGSRESRGLSVQTESKVVGQSAQRDAANRQSERPCRLRHSRRRRSVSSERRSRPGPDGRLLHADRRRSVHVRRYRRRQFAQRRLRHGRHAVSALSIVAFPADGDTDVLEAIMRGGLEKMREAGCAVLGGHSVADPEIKFGYAVTGTIHPDRVKHNSAARARRCAGFHESARHRRHRNRPEARHRTARVGGSRHRLDADAEPRGLRGHAAASTLTAAPTSPASVSSAMRARWRSQATSLWKSIRHAIPLLPGALDAVRAAAIPAV